MKFPVLVSAAVILLSQAVLAQFSGFEDAPTRRGSASINSAALEGIFLDTQKGQKEGQKDVTVTFVLTKLSSAFFDSYDKEQKEIIIDFYDTHVGESPLDSIKEHPITGNWVEDTQVDLNKDVAGLKPDFRDVVRVHLKSDFEIKYEISEEFGVVNLKFSWSKAIERGFGTSKKIKYFAPPLVTVLLGGIGWGIYKCCFEDPTEADINYVSIPLPERPVP